MRCRVVALCAIVLSGCSALMEFDPAQLSRAVEDCANGEDDNDDGATDCADAQCWPTVACLPEAPLVRDAACPRRERLGFSADFRDVDDVLTDWSLDGGPSSALDAAGLVLGRTTDEGWIASRAPFPFGAGQRLRVELEAHLVENFGRSESVDLRIGIGDAAVAGARAEVSLQWLVFADHETLLLRCAVRGRAPQVVEERRSETGLPLRLVVETERGRLIARAGSTPGFGCAADGLADRPDAPASLAVIGRRSSEYAPMLRVDRVAVTAAPRAESCDGIREPLLAPGDCALDLVSGVVLADPERARPHVVAVPGGGWMLLAPAFDRTTETRILLALASADGRSGFRSVRAPVDLPWDTRAVDVSESGELIAYGVCTGCAGRLHALAGDLAGVGSLGPVLLDGEAPPAAFPGAVIQREGVILAYWREPTTDGRSQVRVARATDRRTFTSLPHQVVGPSSWSSHHVGASLAVAALKDGVALAYGGEGDDALLRTGLASSRDGLHFREHPRNPILVGEDRGFDHAGTSPIALALGEGPRLRVWYLGDAAATPNTCVAGPTLDGDRRLGLGELAP